MADTCLNVKFRKTNTLAELKSLLAKTKDSKADFSLEIKEQCESLISRLSDIDEKI